jgi:hypothetical protein
MKRGMKSKKKIFSCFSWFQEEVFKKITHPGSGKNSFRIQGVKMHRIPDPDPVTLFRYIPYRMYRVSVQHIGTVEKLT